ncbi:MAG: hypothetical protein ACM3MG_03135 [Bacillota bacterium]
MSSSLKKAFEMKTEIMCLSFALLSTACSPMSFTPAGQASALQQDTSPVGSSEVAGSPSNVVSSSGTTQTSAPVVTSDQGTLVTTSPFSADISLPKCVDTTQDPFTFELISGADDKVVSAQVTSLPTDASGAADYQNYSAYAVYQQDGHLQGEIAHIEATIDNQGVYGYFNCNLQTYMMSELDKKLNIPWVNSIPRTKISVLMPDASAKPVGILLENQKTQQIVLRCFK